MRTGVAAMPPVTQSSVANNSKKSRVQKNIGAAIGQSEYPQADIMRKDAGSRARFLAKKGSAPQQ